MSEDEKKQGLVNFLEITNTKIIVETGLPENDPVIYALIGNVEEGRGLIRHLENNGIEHMIIGNYGGELAVVNRGDMGNPRETVAKLEQLGVVSEAMSSKARGTGGSSITRA